MKKLIILLFCILSFNQVFSQNRDTIFFDIPLRFVADLPIATDTLEAWSGELSNYVHYSRIDMGNRMNYAINESKKAKREFIIGGSLITLGGTFFVFAAYNDPVVYVESHSYYTREYFDKSKRNRNTKVIIGTAFTALGGFYIYKSRKTAKKARWYISPNSIKYNF